ncbi:MAG: hypothetical protein N2712_03545 [Brevinematales bacterium]|nr:hypothetical protein [Brevinematales bacterium]
MLVFLLSIISVSLLNFISFFYLDAYKLYEHEKLKLVSEKEVFETINQIKTGEFRTNIDTRTNTDNFIYKVKKIFYKTNNIYDVIVSLETDRAKISRKINFYAILPTDFAYILTDNMTLRTNTRCVFWGYCFIKSIGKQPSEVLFAYTYPPLFSNSTNISVNSYISSAEISPETPSLRLNIKYQTRVVNQVDINIQIDNIIKIAESLADKDWIVRKYEGEVEEIVNPLISEKEFLGNLYYSSPKIKLSKEIDNIYFSETKPKSINLFENADTFGSRGEITKKFLNIENGYLSFNTQPVDVPISPDSFSKPFRIKLNSSTMRIVSKHRPILGIYFDKTNQNLLGNEISIEGDEIVINSSDIKNKYYSTIGRGDGKKSRFRIPSNITPQKVFVGDTELKGFFVENFEIILPVAPEKDKEIVVLHKIPKIYIKKGLPKNGTYLFTDKAEKAVLIDFDRIQNLPKNGIIFSYLPIVVKGSPNEPVIVISKENIYIDNINNIPNPKTLVIISSKGIFLKEYVEILRNVIIVSKLDGIYKVGTPRVDDVSNERSKWIFGTTILTGELKNSKTEGSYITSYEDPINNSTFSISSRVMEDYISSTTFGETIRKLLPPIVVLRKIK